MIMKYRFILFLRVCRNVYRHIGNVIPLPVNVLNWTWKKLEMIKLMQAAC